MPNNLSSNLILYLVTQAEDHAKINVCVTNNSRNHITLGCFFHLTAAIIIKIITYHDITLLAMKVIYNQFATVIRALHVVSSGLPS